MIKWIGGGIGWFLGSTTGGLLGFVAGTVVDSFELHTIFKKNSKKKTFGIFSTNILMLIASVLKAERPVSINKIDYVRQFLKKNFGEKQSEEALLQLKEIMKQEIQLIYVCKQIRSNLDYSSRMQLSHFLNRLIAINETVSESEQYIVNIISDELGIKSNTRQFAAPILNESVVEAYKMLEIKESSNVSDIKKAFRILALKYHPDTMTKNNCDEAKRKSNEKFHKLIRAYNILKKERKFK